MSRWPTRFNRFVRVVDENAEFVGAAGATPDPPAVDVIQAEDYNDIVRSINNLQTELGAGFTGNLATFNDRFSVNFSEYGGWKYAEPIEVTSTFSPSSPVTVTWTANRFEEKPKAFVTAQNQDWPNEAAIFWSGAEGPASLQLYGARVGGGNPTTSQTVAVLVHEILGAITPAESTGADVEIGSEVPSDDHTGPYDVEVHI